MAVSMRTTLLVLSLVSGVTFVSCHKEDRESPQAGGTPLVLAAGVVGLTTSGDRSWTAGVDTSRLGLEEIDGVYDLTTPAGEPFAFDAIARAAGNSGEVRLSLAHVDDGGTAVSGGPGSLAIAGIAPSASGLSSTNSWLNARGDGFARFTVRGKVERDQVLALETSTEAGGMNALVRVRIGERSAINGAAGEGDAYPGVLQEGTIYSSNSWSFGLPTAAVSGDRTSIVCYEGDRADPFRGDRFEMRLQHDRVTGTVTGGGSKEASPDSGHWRDHEIAALYNVLALVHGGAEAVSVKLSFDRGASFGQTEVLWSGSEGYRPRLAQLSMAADYSLAVLYWRSSPDGTTSLELVEGRPSAFDGGGSPTAYKFDGPLPVHEERGDVTPLLMEAAWSEGGDLVVGFAFTRFNSMPDRSWEIVTQNRCAVRPWGGAFEDRLIEEDRIVGRDPSVALIGSGPGLTVFYAYEGREGVLLRMSEDAGRTFSAAISAGDPGSHTPSVLARRQGDALRVDLLYLTDAGSGTELHLLHWDDFRSGLSSRHRLTRAAMVPFDSVPPDSKAPGISPGIYPPPGGGSRITEVAWLGYDAVLDGDDAVVVVDEQTYDAWYVCMGLDGGSGFGSPTAFEQVDFTPADPPPLAPGLTEPMPAPDPAHMHQLKLIRLD
jgi:hypothetical protein